MIHCLDTSYILALELTSDQYHRPAQQHWQQLRANLPPMLTSTYVFDEIVTFFSGSLLLSKSRCSSKAED